ncbi:MAG: molybdenum cofactor guanylyltransferase [Nostoc sp.]|uniref:molybdenum cofactor guanylyltransferase n=1 Tax=Nostoc sp. TaxID=1180 RepID=UPI002FF585C6
MTNRSELTAIVLAGGKSSRMGQDKALIPIEGVPLLQRVCGIAKGCVDVVYIVTPWPERYQDLLLPGCELIREVALSGESLAHGPLVGFAQGLAEVKTDWVLLLACDLPRLRVEVLQDWATRLASVADNAIAALAEHPKGWEPLCGFYRRRCLPQLLEFINQGGRSFQQWLRQYPVEVLPLAEPEMLFNCNTPEDLALS